jgi:hypothetical protein
VRYACLTECLVRIDGAALGGDWPGMAFNISRSGIALALPFPVPVGAVLTIDRRSSRGAPPRRAQVVRSRLERCVWFHGCSFAEPLTEHELHTWVPRLLDDGQD